MAKNQCQTSCGKNSKRDDEQYNLGIYNSGRSQQSVTKRQDLQVVGTSLLLCCVYVVVFSCLSCSGPQLLKGTLAPHRISFILCQGGFENH